MAKPITIKITGDASGLKRALDGASDMVGKFGSAVTTAVKGGALAGAGAAAAGIAAFTEFDTQLREVLTLLPGAGEETFDKLGDKVKEFSAEFGKLPSEVIPSLYSALSAGVPEDNVFEFLEIAQQAAKGGVTELETAVDGISSVVNAYGSNVISATEASDLMFTAVRLGKTNFEELSGSLYNVTPIASSLGVQFEDVTAALAALTASGTPTSVATTQLRAAFSELGKEGTKVSDIFREQTGQSFQEFLDSTNEFGRQNTLYDALGQISVAARESDKEILDLFGSVEAGSAVMSLAANEKFGDALGDMANSAGATAAAFDVMDGSLGSSFDRIKANLAVAAVDLGEKLAPTVQKVTDFIVDHLDEFYAFADRVKEAITPFFMAIVEAGSEVIAWVSEHWPQISDVIGQVADFLQKSFQKIAEWARQYIPPAIDLIVDVFQKIIGWVRQNWPTFQTIITGVIDAVTAVLTAIVDWVRDNWGRISEIFTTVKDAVVEAITLVIDIVSSIVGVFQEVTDGAEGESNRLIEIVKGILEYFTVAWETLAEIVKRAVEIIQFVWRNFGDEIMAVIKGAIEFVVNTIEAFLDIITGIFKVIKGLVTGEWGEMWDGIKQIFSGWWDWMVGALTFIKDTIVGIFGGLVSTVKDKLVEMVNGAVDFLLSVPERLWDAANGLGTAILDGLKAGISGAISLVTDIVSAIKNALIDSLNWVIQKMNDGIPDKLGWGALSIDIPDNPIPLLSKAMGGPASGRVLVGERGPEEVILPRGSRVRPNHSLSDAGGVTVNVTTNADPHLIGREVAWVLKTAGV